MAEFERDDPLRQALSGLAAEPDRPADAVLADLRPALGRARLRHRVNAMAMTAAAVVLAVIGGVAVFAPTEARPVEVGGEASDPVQVPPTPDLGERVSSTTVAESTTLVTTPTVPSETTAVVVTTALVPKVVDEPGPDPEAPGPSPEPTWPPVVLTAPSTTPAPPTTTAPPAQSVVIGVQDAGTITVGYTSSAITEVAVTTVPGSSYEIEDRTEHEVKVNFEGNRKVEVEIHLEDGEITHQIDGDDSDS